MHDQPILGGLKKLLEHLEEVGKQKFIFQMSIYDDGQKEGLRQVPGKVKDVSLNSLISEHGPMDKMSDVRIISEKGDVQILFSGITHIGMTAHQHARKAGWKVIPETNNGNYLFGYLPKGINDESDFRDIRGATEGRAIVNLACYGKMEPGLWDRFQFRYLPRRYAKRVFAQSA